MTEFIIKRDKPKQVVKCEGRFKELRELVFEAVPLVLEGDSGIRTNVRETDLMEIWGLIEDDVLVFRQDIQDPYFESEVDLIRKKPILYVAENSQDLDETAHMSLTPLFPSNYAFSEGLVRKHSLLMGNSDEISGHLEHIAKDQPGKFFQILGRDPSRVYFPDGQNLAGYVISAL